MNKIIQHTFIKVLLKTEKIIKACAPNAPNGFNLRLFLQFLALLCFLQINSSTYINGSINSSTNSISQTLKEYHYISIATSIFCLCLIAAIIYFLFTEAQHLQDSNSSIDNFNSNYCSKNMLSIIATLYLTLQLILLPSLIIITQSVQITDQYYIILIYSMAAISLSFFVLKQPQKYLYNQHILIIFSSYLIFNTSQYLLIFLGFSLYYSLKQTNKTKKIIYFQFSWLLLVELIARQTESQICNFYRIIMIVVIAFSMVTAPINQSFSQVQQNDLLLKYIKQLQSSQLLSNQDLYKIYQIIYRWKENYQLNIKPYHLFQTSNQKTLDEVNKNISRQTLKSFLMLKLQINIQENTYDIISRIQKIACTLLDSQFSIKLIYQIQKLKNDFQDILTFQQREKYEQLINEVQIVFLKKQSFLNSKLIIQIEKQTQIFYQNLVEIIKNVQDVWHRIKQKYLTENKLHQKLNQILDYQKKCQDIITHGKFFRNMEIQIQAFHYLMTLVNAYHQKIKQWTQITLQDKKKLIRTNYIHVINHKITDISNNLVNVLNMTKNELIGIKLQSLFAKGFKKYISNNIETILKVTTNPKQIILPLKIEGIHQYLMPFKSKFQILPDLHGGSQYIIQILECPELRKSPIFLYSINFDRITSCTSNLYSFLSQSDFEIDGSIQASNLFDIDIESHINFDQQVIGHQFPCKIKKNRLNKFIKKMNTNLKPELIQFKVLEIYKINDQKTIMIQLKLKTKQQQKITDVSQGQSLSDQKIEVLNQKYRSNWKTQRGQTFCKIPNPFETEIQFKMAQQNNNSNISYLKLLWILLAFIILIFLTALGVIRYKNISVNNQLSTMFNQNINVHVKIQQIYLLFYQNYQYYHIKNYPEHYLAIQKYNMTCEQIQYKQKALDNINSLLIQLFDDGLGQKQLPYQLQFQEYFVMDFTNSISLIDFLSEVKFAISSNNPIMMIRNQHVIDTIIDSYLTLSLDELNQFAEFLLYFFALSTIMIIIIILLAKYFLLNIKAIIVKILDIYEIIDSESIVNNEKRMNQFVQLLKNANVYPRKKQNSEIIESNSIKIQAINLKKEKQDQSIVDEQNINKDKKVKIKKRSIFTFLIKNNILCILPLIILVYYGVYYIQIQIYSSNIDNIINYQENIQNSITDIIHKAEEFYQAALEKNLPLQYQTTTKQTMRHLSKFYRSNNLPQFFKDYKIQQSNRLQGNLCSYSSLNTGSLYNNINCSAILYGIMNSDFSQTYSSYLDLVESNLGVTIKDFGTNFRIGAIYPVFMQICYIRRTVYSILSFLQGEFNDKATQFIIQQANYLQIIIWFGIFLVPIILIISYLFAKQTKKYCQFGLKCFKMIPKNFMLKRSITKILIKNKILHEITWLF